ncbi:hypothetical protein CF327_g4223 [Tilletia walkeri]|uniref:SCP domain-containing protein n=1 Tax=Tilletia walkeri TaxID=117179 RepID=A0A8X7N7A3_9BASI|nr:hypothetical protein CF327_g4223 [Tilletia walkeri]KAE8267668.1 hypothetical protein A4X09_0g4678 [Tilletia walkeri]
MTNIKRSFFLLLVAFLATANMTFALPASGRSMEEPSRRLMGGAVGMFSSAAASLSGDMQACRLLSGCPSSTSVLPFPMPFPMPSIFPSAPKPSTSSSSSAPRPSASTSTSSSDLKPSVAVLKPLTSTSTSTLSLKPSSSSGKKYAAKIIAAGNKARPTPTFVWTIPFLPAPPKTTTITSIKTITTVLTSTKTTVSSVTSVATSTKTVSGIPSLVTSITLIPITGIVPITTVITKTEAVPIVSTVLANPATSVFTVTTVRTTSTVLSVTTTLPATAPSAAPITTVVPVTTTLTTTAIIPVTTTVLPPTTVAAGTPTTTFITTTVAATPTTIVTGDPTTAEQQAVVDTHNTYRAKHNAPSLTWNNTLAAYALTHASKCIWAHSGGPYGENGAATVGVATTMASSADMWYNEITMYNFSAPAFTEQTGHFSQLIWKSSRTIGCAAVQCTPASLGFAWTGPEMATNVWCEYSNLPGNVIGQFDTNVLAPIGIPLVNGLVSTVGSLTGILSVTV